MSLIYSIGNYIDAITINSVSSEHTLYVKENLYNLRPSLPFRFTAKTDQFVELDMATDKNITLLALINHNLQQAATIRLEADNDPPNWLAPSYSQAVTWRAENLYMKLDETYRWWRIFASDPTNPYYPELGEAILYIWNSFSDARIRSQSEGDSFYTAIEETFMGQDWDAELSRKAKLSFTIRDISTHGDSVLEEIRAFIRELKGQAGRFLVVPDDTTTECYFAKALGLEFISERIFHNIKDVRDWALPLSELTQGFNLL